MDWKMLSQIIIQGIESIDFSLFMRPEILAPILVSFIAIERKRGPGKALFLVLAGTLSLFLIWQKLQEAQGEIFHHFYMAGFIGAGSLILLYIIYLYTIHAQVE